jgi:HAD superfamily hydrolase (TIGR01549 family)
MKKVFSFDIFDTLITRCFAEPIHLFESVGRELVTNNVISITAEEWTQIRISAETEARQNSKHEEITLSEIYQQVCYKMNVPESFGEQMEQLEIDKELTSLTCIAPHATQVNSLRGEGHKVIFISDMYLPSDTIKQALLANNIECHDEDLFVSSTYRETKHTGKLFLRVLNHLQIKPDQLTHTGDNIFSDYQMPKSLGIKAVHFSNFGTPGREQLISRSERLPLSFKSLIASAVRLNRLNSTHHDSHKNHIHSISSTVIAPILFGFTLWTLLEAKKKGLTSLHFISRDGQILKQIADRINNVLRLNITCKYFYGSRQAFHLPAITEEDWDHLDWLYDDTSFFSVRLIFGRVELAPDPMESHLSQNGFARAMWDSNLNSQERLQLRQVLQQSQIFKDLVLERAEIARDKLLSYLKQEGINASAKMAFVDIGWNGRLQRSLSKVMQAAGIKPHGGLNGFYFGLRQRLKASAEDNLFAWYYDEENLQTRYNNVVILEKFVEATHGSVVGYKTEKDLIEPIFKEEENQEALRWGLEVQQASILGFTDLLCSNLQKMETSELVDANHWTNMTETLLSDFCKYPSALDARTFGSVSISEDQNHARSYPLAKPLTLKNCISLLLRKKPDVYNDLWINGSLHLTRGGNLVAGCLKMQDTLIGYIRSKISA